MSQEDFLDVLGEAVGLSEVLTTGERDFLIETTELSPSDFDEASRSKTRLSVTSSLAAAEKEVERTTLSTQEVARILGRAESNVRRSRLNGDLYAVHAGITGRTLRFPGWQFTDSGEVIPGLRSIVPALPTDFHPLDIEAFMISPHEALDGQDPVRWLATGGSIDSVVNLADELGYQ